MANPTISSNGEKLLYFIQEKYESNNLTNEDVVSIIVLGFDLLGLKTISDS